MRRDEDGQVSVMIVGFFIIVALLAVVVVNSSAAFLQRQELNNVADGAALVAADGLDKEALYRHGIGEDAPLDAGQVREDVADYLASTGNADTRWQVMLEHDRVHIHLERPVELALIPPGWASSSTVTADATGVLRVAR